MASDPALPDTAQASLCPGQHLRLRLSFVVGGGFWAAPVWEVPILLGTDPGMKPWSLPSAWEACMLVKQLDQRQGHGLGDLWAKSAQGWTVCPLTFPWFRIWVFALLEGL